MNEKDLGLELQAVVLRRYILDFHRHDKKESTSIDRTDKKIQLTPEGRINAVLATPRKDIRFGSEDRITASFRDRAIHTAILRALGGVTPSYALALAEEEASVEYLRSLVGNRLHIEPRLGFIGEAGNEYFDEYMKYADNGRELEFIVQHSDRWLVSTGQNKQGSDSYSTFAANIASLIKDRVIEAKEARVFNPQPIWEHAGTHSGIVESFLLKTVGLLAEKAGENATQAQQKLLAVWTDPDGYERGLRFSEGVRVEIVNYQDRIEPVVKVVYEKDDYSLDIKIPSEVLDEIITEGKSVREAA